MIKFYVIAETDDGRRHLGTKEKAPFAFMPICNESLISIYFLHKEDIPIYIDFF